MKKLFPYILILAILAGLLSPLASISAAGENGTCVIVTTTKTVHYNGALVYYTSATTSDKTVAKDEGCKAPESSLLQTYQRFWSPSTPGFCLITATRDPSLVGAWAGAIADVFTGSQTDKTVTVHKSYSPITSAECNIATIMLMDSNVKDTDTPVWSLTDTTKAAQEAAASGGSAFDQQISQRQCLGPATSGIFPALNPGGCVVQLLFYGFYMPAAFILTAAAYIFNSLLAISLGSSLLKSTFVLSAWSVVRDLSNIFFILILLYVSIQTILGMGHDTKKMIVKVVIIALIINFSMFFTEVVIDSSNILALVFYNKLQVNTTEKVNGQDQTINYTPVTTSGDQDVAGGMTNAFNPTKLLSQDFFKTAVPTLNGYPAETGEKPNGLIIGMLLVAGAVMLFAAYAFFMSGISFLGRLIELWVLIIFSPFAFMSSTVPKLSGQDYIGWDAWLKRLIDCAFMAPIFMFFMYFIFLLIKANLFGGLVVGAGVVQLILSVVLPALFILILLLKATEFAKKGSGKFGEMVAATAKLAGGAAIGLASGGAGFALSNTVGRVARNQANDETLKARAAAGDKGAQRRLALANSLAKNSFDVRQTGLGKFASKQTGMDFNKGTGVIGIGEKDLKGGRKERDKEATKKLDDVRKTYEMSTAHGQAQDGRAAQYKADKENFEKNVGFIDEKDEAQFKKAYEEGNQELLSAYGIERNVKAGSVQTSKEVNEERKKSYALSLENPTSRIKDGEVIKKGLFNGFGSSWKSGMEKMAYSPQGLAAIAAAGVATGGVGAALAVPIGGLAFAIKDMAKAWGQRIPPFGEHQDIVAGVRKGVTPDLEHALHELNEAAGVKHEEHPPAAHPPAPATAAPATPGPTPAHPPTHP